MDIKKAIREKMKARKMSAVKLAEMLGEDIRRVREFLNEPTRATLARAEKSLDYLGYELCDKGTTEKLQKAEKLLLILGVEIAKEKSTETI